MKIIAQHMADKKLVGDALELAAEAKKRKQENPLTRDATIGTLSTEDGKFYKFPTIDKIIRTLDDINIYGYSPVDGGPLFKEAVINWVFQEEKQILNNMYYRVVSTSGGTGAVSNAISNSLDKGQTLLIPDIYWGPYETIASTNEHQLMKFTMIVDDRFNIEGFTAACDEIITKQGKVVVILNDPCNNPTGYSLTNSELEAVINYMNSRTDAVFSLIYDIAYIDYANEGPLSVRKKYNILAKANKNIVISIAFSCSKTFSIYGLRTGAHIILGQDEESVDAFYKASCLLARTRWSNVSRVGIFMLVTLMNNPQLIEQFKLELAQANVLLKSRSELFVKEAFENGLDIYPYRGGFFMTVKTRDGKKLAEELKKQDIYVLPFDNAIRISISALSVKEISGLAEIIQKSNNRL